MTRNEIMVNESINGAMQNNDLSVQTAVIKEIAFIIAI